MKVSIHLKTTICNSSIKNKNLWIPGLACVQDAADHSWHHHDEHGKQLQVPTHDAGGLHVRHILARQAALHNDLPGKHDLVMKQPAEGNASSGVAVK